MNLPRSIRLPTWRVFYGWKVVAASSVINAAGGGVNHQGFIIFFLPLTRELELSRAAVSLLYSAARLQSGVERPITGWLVDRVGARPLLLAGLFLAGLGYVLMTQVHSFVTLFLAYFCLVSLGANASSMNTLTAAINTWFIRYKSVALSIVDASSGLGGGAIVPLLSVLIQKLGWRYAALASGLIIWIVALPFSLAIHRSPESRGLNPDGLPQPPRAASGGQPASGTVDFTTAQGLRTFAYWLLAASIALRMMVTTAITVHMVPLIVSKGVSEATAALLVAALALATIPSRLLFGWLGTRLSWSVLSGFGCLAGMASVLSLLVIPSAASVYAFIFFLTLTEGTIFFNWALVGDFFGRRSFATLMGLMGPAHSLVTFGSPVFAGWVYDRTDSYAAALITFCALIGIGGVMFLLLRRPRLPQGGSTA